MIMIIGITLHCFLIAYLSTRGAENTEYPVVMNFEKSTLQTPTDKILPYLSSAQRDLTGAPLENIWKPIITDSTLNSDT